MKIIPWVISILLAAYIVVTTFVPRIGALDEVARQNQPLAPTWTPVIIERTVEVVVTATPEPASLVSVAMVPTETPLPTAIAATPTPTVTQQPAAATTIQQANLRTGPGTNYDVTGGISAGSALDVVGRNATNDWYQLADGNWIFGQLVSNAPQSLPIVDAPPPPPTSTPAPTAEPTQVPPPVEATQPPPSNALVGTINVDSWRFEISEVRVDPGLDVGRQSIIFLGYLFNMGTQTDTFVPTYRILLVDSQGRQYEDERKVSWAAQDKYGTEYAASINPEARKYIAIGYDVPATEKSFTLVPGSLAASWGQNVSVAIP